jgi:hypothetical protein
MISGYSGVSGHDEGWLEMEAAKGGRSGGKQDESGKDETEG